VIIFDSKFSPWRLWSFCNKQLRVPFKGFDDCLMASSQGSSLLLLHAVRGALVSFAFLDLYIPLLGEHQD
jgi:hypothetical protein